MKPTAANLIRWSGLAAIVGGVIFAGIQPIHPPDVLASVTTQAWAIITTTKLAMCFLLLLGLVGLYARQVEKAGWLGLAGFLLFGFSWALQSGFVFVESLVLPLLSTAAPQFVESALTVANRQPGSMPIGALPALYSLVAITYLLGGLIFGIATFRARVLPRWPAGLLAVSGVLAAVMVSLLPHPLDRLAAVPMGLALAWLGYALLSERREKAVEPARGVVNAQLSQTGAD